MNAHHTFLRYVIPIYLAFSIIACCLLNSSYAEEEPDDLSIEVIDDEIHVFLTDPTSMEIFRVIVLENGGISEIRIAHMTYATTAGWCVWEEDGPQATGSDATGDPIIQDMDDYVTLTCFSEYLTYPLSIRTDLTITRTGVIFVSSTLTADEDAPTVTMIAWGLWGLPGNVFAGSKAYVSVEGSAVQEVDLPGDFVEGAAGRFETSQTTFWMDFSKPMEGITVVSLDPNLYVSYVIWDQRENGTVFSAELKQADWGEGAMARDEVKKAEAALCIHGAGGYQSALNMINLLADLGKAKGSSTEGVESFTDEGAKSLASQALAAAESAYSKIIRGDVVGGRDDLDEASNLLRQAEDAERSAAMMRDLSLAAVPIIVIIVLVIVLKMRRRKQGP